MDMEKKMENWENADVQTISVYMKDKRSGKNHSGILKTIIKKLDDDHVVTDRNHIYYKSHLNSKNKFQNKECTTQQTFIFLFRWRNYLSHWPLHQWQK